MTKRAHSPSPAPIEAYGNGGFRFGGMSHKGSLLCLPSGIWAWPVTTLGDIDAEALAHDVSESGDVRLLLLGTGAVLAPAPRPLRSALEARGLTLETMDTGAAARTYNILLAEGRQVAAALIAVD